MHTKNWKNYNCYRIDNKKKKKSHGRTLQPLDLGKEIEFIFCALRIDFRLICLRWCLGWLRCRTYELYNDSEKPAKKNISNTNCQILLYVHINKVKKKKAFNLSIH